MSKETIEVAIFKSKFPNEDFCPDNFNEWVSENAGEAYDMCLYLAVQQLEDCKEQRDELLGVLKYIVDNNDGCGIALGYRADEMATRAIKKTERTEWCLKQ